MPCPSYLPVTEDGGRVTLSWTREEPSDEHSVGTAKAVAAVDLMVVKKTFPRATAA